MGKTINIKEESMNRILFTIVVMTLAGIFITPCFSMPAEPDTQAMLWSTPVPQTPLPTITHGHAMVQAATMQFGKTYSQTVITHTDTGTNLNASQTAGTNLEINLNTIIDTFDTTSNTETSIATAEEIVQSGETYQIRYSHYWPPLGGTNCSWYVDGTCRSKMASGLAWQDYVGIAAACPPEWPFGTKVILDGQEWICKDRGGAIQFINHIPWVDFLTPYPAYDYGTIVEAEIVFN